ncbi:MAG: toprim domain-containing protein [Burkholderiales bacterium]|nr:toprim domain-containing protein [Burkholderiales bacterium]
MIPAGFLQDLIARVDIVDVVGRHVELKRGGANWMGLCPFHAEKSPSFSVTPAKQFYYCFGCGASGDAIRFLCEHTGMSFVDAVSELAQGVGMQVPQEQVSPEERQNRQRLAERRLSLTNALEKAAMHYRKALRHSPQAIAYLKARGLSGETAARFGLGYAPAGWHGLAGVFAAYDDPVLEDAGLVRASVEADAGEAAPEAAAESTVQPLPEPARLAAAPRRRWDWFRHRIMFPIRAVGGEVVGFGGRVLDDSKPKYLNSPETAVFSKGRELYGLHEARQAIRERGHALVVEGYMDVVMLAQHGFANAVATLGTACTAEHVQKLLRFTDSIVFAFDGDAAGRRAAARALEAALPYATDLRRIRFLFLPPEHDPDSFVRERGTAAFEQALAEAVPLSRQLQAQAAADCDLGSAEGRARMLAQAQALWAALPAGALQRQLLGELAHAGQMEPAELAALWGSGRAPSGRSPVRGDSAAPWKVRPRAGARPMPTASSDLALRLLLRHADWWDRLCADDHQHLHELGGEHGALVAWLEGQLLEHGAQTWAALDEALQGHPLHAAARRIVDPDSLQDEHEFSDLERVLHRLWESALNRQIAALIEGGHTDREHLDRIAALRRRADEHKRLAATAGEPSSHAGRAV